jgi:hypothetical protein
MTPGFAAYGDFSEGVREGRVWVTRRGCRTNFGMTGVEAGAGSVQPRSAATRSITPDQS